MGSTISLNYPPGFILLCIGCGVFYAWLAYAKPGPWGKTLQWTLFILRSLLVSLLAILLLAPIIRQINNFTEKPLIVVALDNSSSVSAVYDSSVITGLMDNVNHLSDALKDNDYEVEFRDLAGNQEELSQQFDANATNLDALLQNIANTFEGRHIQDVILISDGIYNEGISPSFRSYPFPIETVGLGDSIPKKDIYLDELRYNKIAYQGNKFPLVATIMHHGFANETLTVDVLRDGKRLQSKEVTFGNDDSPTEIEFLLDADKTGYQHYVVSVRPRDSEFIKENNRSNAFIEVVKGKQLIYLVAASPHPDLKAIVTALESSSNYQVEQFILSLPDDLIKYKATKERPDLTILHQLPAQDMSGIDWKERLQGRSYWMIYGSAVNMNYWSSQLPWMSMQHVSRQFDKITGITNPGFSAFQLSDHLISMLDEFPPIVAPFGELSMDPDASGLLFQRIGSIETRKPLLAIKQQDDYKAAVFLASGLWQWKLTDYSINKNNNAFNELITKLVQYLSSRDDKRRFRVYPVTSEFNLGEEVVFEAEVYNELYERIYGNKIQLTLTSPSGEVVQYSYVTSEGNSRYRISGLAQGVYQYTGSTELEGKSEKVSGQVVIIGKDLEMMNLTADFNELRNLSGRTGGNFYHIGSISSLIETYSEKEAQGIIHSEEQYSSAIDLEWLFVILLLFATVEWGVRKYQGSY